MFALETCVGNLLSALPPHPVAKEILDAQLDLTVAEAVQKVPSSENRKDQWQFLLREEVYRVAATGCNHAEESNKTYYDLLYSRLDMILSLTERQCTDESFVLLALQDLLETQSVASCSHIFTWIEENGTRLTLGMQATKGKSLVLLRTLNDLLRRLSKTGSTAMLCGRILIFLSTIFPMGERSGVNLRGEYGPQWEGVSYRTEPLPNTMDVDETQATAVNEGNDNDIVMEESDATKENAKSEENLQKSSSSNALSEQAKKEEFYNTFWSLQLPFSRPPVLVSSIEKLEEFKSAIGMVLPVIKEATIKERAMMGSKAVVGSLKRKREATPTPLNNGDQKYLFPKFLTSPELLDLEIADTAFRRQFLFQLLGILDYLLLFTKEVRQAAASWKNKAVAKPDFTLKSEDVTWIQETISKTYEEMRQTAPNGRAFTDTIQTILEREKNWVAWKNDNCVPFDQDPLPESLEDSTAPLREKIHAPLQEFEHRLGSAALTEIWDMGYRDTEDLKRVFNPGSVKDFVSSIEKENARIKFRKQQLEKQAQARARLAVAKPATPTPVAASNTSAPEVSTPAAPVPLRPAAASPPLHPSLPAKPGTQPSILPPVQLTPAPAPSPAPAPRVATPVPVVAPPPELTDPIIMRSEETKTKLSWLALRLAREEHLHHFGKIGNGDVVALQQEIEKEKEQFLRGESQPSGTGTAGTSPGPENMSVLPSAPDLADSSETVKTEGKDIALSVGPKDTDLGSTDAKMEDADKPAEQTSTSTTATDAA